MKANTTTPPIEPRCLHGMPPANCALCRVEAVRENRPRAYDLNDPNELVRLYRECHGYLRTCHHKHGTDWEGRKFAIDALNALAQWPR